MVAYRAQIEKDEDGRWSAWVEELPGCAAWGYTRTDALDAIIDATGAYLEDMIAGGEEIPQ